MMRWLTTMSIQSRLLVVSIATALMIFSVVQLSQTSLEIYPEFSPVYVEIQTEALGLSATEVEQLLTVALEQDLLNGIAFLDEIWSQSLPGLSRVVCIFEPGTDPMSARQVVQERLTQAHALPNVSSPPVMLQPNSSTSRIMKVGLSSTDDAIDLIDMSVLARWNIQPYLMGVEGVSNVSIWGQRKRQLQVLVDPNDLRQKGVSLNEVVKTTGEALWVSPLSYLNSSTPGTGGFFDTPNQRLGVRHVLPVSEPKDLASIPVHGHDLLLADVSTVVENHQPMIGDAIVNGSPGLLLVIEKFPWANTLEVSEKIEDALDELRPGLTGIVLDTEVYQPARYAEASADNISRASGIALLLLAALLFLFFYDWRTAVVGLFSAVLSITAGAYVLHLMGISLNMMTLAGLVLALALILNNAIFTTDNIKRKLSQYRNIIGKKTKSSNSILAASLELQSPLLYTTIIILLGVLPLFAFTGLTEAFLEPMVISYVLATLVTLIVTLAITPALSVMLHKKGSMVFRESKLVSGIRNFFDPTIERIIHRPGIALSLFGVLLVSGILLFPLIEKNFEPPELTDRDLLIQIESNQATSQPEMNRLLTNVIGEINTVPGIRTAVAHTGRAVMSDKISNLNNGEIWVNIDDDIDYYKTLNTLQGIVDGYPGINNKIHNYHAQRVSESLIPEDHKYAYRVYGENQEMLKQKTEEVREAIAGVNGITAIELHDPAMEPAIEIEVNLEAARKHGVKPGEVRRNAAILLAGITAGSLFEGQKVFEVVVWGKPEIRQSISSVENLLIGKPNGEYVRLAEVANVRVKPNPAVIQREAVSRYMDVSFNLEGTNIRSILPALNESISKVDFPLEYHAVLTGSYAAINTVRTNFISYLIAAFIGILLLLQAAFWSWRFSFLATVSLPVAMSGGIIILSISGLPFSLGTVAGCLAIMGLTAYHLIHLIKHIKNQELLAAKMLNTEMIHQAIRDRFAPIVLSSISILAVFLPVVFIGKVPGMEMIFPMSIVILGGLVTSLMVVFFVLPALYLRFGKISEAELVEERSMLENQPEKSIAAMV